MDRRVSTHIIRIVPLSLLFIVLVLPLMLLLFQWLTDTDRTVLLSFTDQKTLLLIGKSLWMSFTAALLATCIGTICGFLLYKLKIPYSGFYKLALLLPLLISSYIFAVPGKTGSFGFWEIRQRYIPKPV